MKEDVILISKIWKKDLYKNKSITLSLYIFILLSSLLTASSISIFVKLSSSMDSFFQNTAAPDFVQMHAGDFNQKDIDMFVKEHKNLVKKQQTVTLLNSKGADIYFNQKKESEENSVMDIAFVKQNQEFDYLINEANEIVHLKQGEVAIPVYYQQRDNLKKNDILYVSNQGIIKAYKIVDFIKDSQMNASIISSKRILVSDKEYEGFKSFTQPEYLIEFLSDDVPTLERAYQNSSLPHNGTTITKGLLQILNALMDGIIAAILFAIALLLMGIAFLCLRFIILMTLQEDIKEIGIMKAIGIARKEIQKLYMGKYIALTMLGGLSGYVASFMMQDILFKNMQLYMGVVPANVWSYVLPLLSVFLLGICIIGFCKFIVSKMHRITPLQALKSEVIQSASHTVQSLSFSHCHRIPISLLISIQDIWSRKRVYISVFLVGILSSFLIIVPHNLQSTMESKDFIRYMGVGNSDLRMDISNPTNLSKNSIEVEKSLRKDLEVKSYAIYTAYKMGIKNSDGDWENLQVETGDFTKFPLTYIQGNAPTKQQDIALSFAIFNQQDVKIGDMVEVQIQEDIKEMKVCGVYQDVTNGGKSAKAKMSFENIEPLRKTINVDFKTDSSLSKKLTYYSSKFKDIKITDAQGYVTQTLSGLHTQIHVVVNITLVIAFLITIFQISLFIKMLLKKDEKENTIMKCIGVTKEQIQLQYMLRMLILSLLGIIIGTLLANTGGEYLLSICMQSMGVAHLQFTISPWVTYVLLPLFLISGVGIATVLATRKIGDLHIANLTIE